MQQNTKIEDMKDRIGLEDTPSIIAELREYDTEYHVDVLYLLILDDMKTTMEYIHKAKYNIAFYIKLIKAVCFSSYTPHKMAALEIIDQILEKQNEANQYVPYLRNKLSYYFNDKEVKIQVETVRIIAKYSIFDENKTILMGIELYGSKYESLKCMAIDLFLKVDLKKIEYLIDEMMNSISYRVRYNLVMKVCRFKESQENSQIDNLLSKIMRKLHRDDVECIREFIYKREEFYRIHNGTTLFQILDIMVKKKVTSSLRSVFIKNCIKYTKLFENLTMVEKYILPEDWEIKQHIFSLNTAGINLSGVIEDLVGKNIKDYNKIVTILDKIDDTSITNGTISLLISLLSHKVSIVRKKACEILLRKLSLKTNKVYLLSTRKRTKTTSEECLVENIGEQNYLDIIKLNTHTKYQVREDCKELLKLFL